jgi:ferredoxin--NADP+ reductase
MSDQGSERPRYAVAIVGGAVAGAEAAGILSRRGVLCAVFDQNPRPFGKIEDGLPRWHVKLREKEYGRIGGHLDHPLVHFVPNTRIGRDIGLAELARDWGFTAVILAHGAWRDRPLPVEGVDRYLGKGLIYQNSFIYWFNHFPERDYDGPRYEAIDGTIVVGGGLASVDVMKALQIELARVALAKRGIDVDMLRLEHIGLPAVLGEHDLTFEDLGLRGTTLYYRRRFEDMPLTEIPPGTPDKRRTALEAARRKILDKAVRKYCFQVCPQMMPVAPIVEGDRLAGLRFQKTEVVDGKAVGIDGAFEDVRAPQVISSIGSIPEPMPGIPQDGQFYRFADDELGSIEGFETVFSTGNVVTGKGNIKESRKHSMAVSSHLIESFLGLGADEQGEENLLAGVGADSRKTADRLGDWLEQRSPLSDDALRALLERIEARRAAVGCDCSYSDWLARVTPPDLV